jgi:ribosomal protein L19E
LTGVIKEIMGIFEEKNKKKNGRKKGKGKRKGRERGIPASQTTTITNLSISQDQLK